MWPREKKRRPGCQSWLKYTRNRKSRWGALSTRLRRKVRPFGLLLRPLFLQRAVLEVRAHGHAHSPGPPGTSFPWYLGCPGFCFPYSTEQLQSTLFLVAFPLQHEGFLVGLFSTSPARFFTTQYYFISTFHFASRDLVFIFCSSSPGVASKTKPTYQHPGHKPIKTSLLHNQHSLSPFPASSKNTSKPRYAQHLYIRVFPTTNPISAVQHDLKP